MNEIIISNEDLTVDESIQLNLLDQSISDLETKLDMLKLEKSNTIREIKFRVHSELNGITA